MRAIDCASSVGNPNTPARSPTGLELAAGAPAAAVEVAMVKSFGVEVVRLWYRDTVRPNDFAQGLT
jgi:hypothetical protein